MKPTVASSPTRSLSALHTVPLNDAYQAIYDRVAPGAGGPEPWRRRQLGSTHSLLAMSQISERMVIQMLDLNGPLRTIFALKVPVPCRQDGTGPFFIAPSATLGLTYRPEAMLSALPGYSFIEILEPRTVFHPNVAPSNTPPGAQMLCLGPKLAAGIRIVDLVLMAYTAISCQTIQFSLADAAGVLNPAAALWLQANPSCLPLTREPFLSNRKPTP